jgi:hypothetical protein
VTPFQHPGNRSVPAADDAGGTERTARKTVQDLHRIFVERAQAYRGSRNGQAAAG